MEEMRQKLLESSDVCVISCLDINYTINDNGILGIYLAVMRFDKDKIVVVDVYDFHDVL